MSFAEAFSVLALCLALRKNTFDSSLSCKFSFANISVVPVVVFAADFHLFRCLIGSSTLAIICNLLYDLNFLERILVFHL